MTREVASRDQSRSARLRAWRGLELVPSLSSEHPPRCSIHCLRGVTSNTVPTINPTYPQRVSSFLKNIHPTRQSRSTPLRHYARPDRAFQGTAPCILSANLTGTAAHSAFEPSAGTVPIATWTSWDRTRRLYHKTDLSVRNYFAPISKKKISDQFVISLVYYKNRLRKSVCTWSIVLSFPLASWEGADCWK